MLDLDSRQVINNLLLTTRATSGLSSSIVYGFVSPYLTKSLNILYVPKMGFKSSNLFKSHLDSLRIDLNTSNIDLGIEFRSFIKLNKFTSIENAIDAWIIHLEKVNSYISWFLCY